MLHRVAMIMLHNDESLISSNVAFVWSPFSTLLNAPVQNLFPSWAFLRQGDSSHIILSRYCSRPVRPWPLIGNLVSKETVCCVGGKVKHQIKLSTTKSTFCSFSLNLGGIVRIFPFTILSFGFNKACKLLLPVVKDGTSCLIYMTRTSKEAISPFFSSF